MSQYNVADMAMVVLMIL